MSRAEIAPLAAPTRVASPTAGRCGNAPGAAAGRGGKGEPARRGGTSGSGGSGAHSATDGRTPADRSEGASTDPTQPPTPTGDSPTPRRRRRKPPPPGTPPGTPPGAQITPQGTLSALPQAAEPLLIGLTRDSSWASSCNSYDTLTSGAQTPTGSVGGSGPGSTASGMANARSALSPRGTGADPRFALLNGSADRSASLVRHGNGRRGSHASTSLNSPHPPPIDESPSSSPPARPACSAARGGAVGGREGGGAGNASGAGAGAAALCSAATGAADASTAIGPVTSRAPAPVPKGLPPACQKPARV